MLYRSMLRACGSGRRPEVLPLTSDATLPRTPHEVMHAIRASNLEPFQALRHASTSARALHPPASSLPATLPAFVLPSHTLLPGEAAEFVFFEPRYRSMANTVLGLSGGSSSTPPDGRYAHLATPDGVGVVASIIAHQVLPDERVAVRVLAGPRCRVTATARTEAMKEEGAAPLLHVAYELPTDALPEDAEADLELASACLEQLSSLVAISKASANVPPLFSAERLSFWLCQMIIRKDQAQLRVSWLEESTTRARLEFVRRALERATEMSTRNAGAQEEPTPSAE